MTTLGFNLLTPRSGQSKRRQKLSNSGFKESQFYNYYLLLRVTRKVVRETSFPSIPIIKENDGGLGFAYSRGVLV